MAAQRCFIERISGRSSFVDKAIRPSFCCSASAAVERFPCYTWMIIMLISDYTFFPCCVTNKYGLSKNEEDFDGFILSHSAGKCALVGIKWFIFCPFYTINFGLVNDFGK